MAEQENVGAKRDTPHSPPHLEMLELATGHFRSQAIFVAAKLGIADVLKSGPKSCEELANATGAHPRFLYRLLRALASRGVFVEDGSGRFSLTPLGATLQSDSPTSVLAMALLGGAPFHWGSWSNLEHAVMTGESSFEYVHGKELFDYLTENPDLAAIYNGWMTRASELQIPALVKSYDYSRFQTIVDVGGGQGRLLTAILAANPDVRGILFDLPHVVKATKFVDDPGLKGRCSAVEGNMFETVPTGADLYIMKTVIHDWSDELCVRILANCRAAMTEGSRLVLIETVVPPGNEMHASKFMDLNMMVLTRGGQERTEAEYRTLLAAAGFHLARVIETPSPLSLLECTAASG